jgi:hypothetical protein
MADKFRVKQLAKCFRIKHPAYDTTQNDYKYSCQAHHHMHPQEGCGLYPPDQD